MDLKQFLVPYNVLNIICYIRKSRQDIEREKRTGEDTLAEQTALMRKVLDAVGLPYDMKSEIGSGENIDGRVVMQEVLKDLESGKYQAIAVKEVSRLSRGDMGTAQKILDLLKDKRILIITPFKVYDVRNQSDFRQIRFELFLAREEYEMIKERMVGARRIYSSQGRWMSGLPPFGFNADKKTQKLIIHEDEASTVRMIYDLFMNGLNGEEVSYQAIATYLTKIGIPTPRGKKTWSYTQVKKILTNELYIGTIKFKTTEVLKNGKRAKTPESEHIIAEDAHEPIIDKEMWNEVQKKINNKPIQPHNPLDFAPSELASVCSCSVCGGKLVRNCGTVKYKRKDGSESEYVKEFLKCQKDYCMSVKYRDIENAILSSLEQLEKLDEKQLKDALNNIVAKENDSVDVKTKGKMLEQIEQKEKELKQRMEFIYDKYEKGIYSDEMFLQRKSVIDKETAEMIEMKKELDSDEEVMRDDVDIDKVKSNLTSILETYHSLTEKEDKNKLLRTVFKDVVVEIIEKGRGRTPAKFIIYPILRYNILKESL